MKWLFLVLLMAGWVWPSVGQPVVNTGLVTNAALSFTAAATKGPVRLQVPFVLLNNLPVVQATVDGHTGNFIVDTGAEVTLLNQRYFAGGLPTAPTGAGATGALTRTTSYRAGSFVWQDLHLTDVTLTTTDLTHLGAAPLLGLLGADLLTQYAITLDYPNRLVILQTAAAPSLPPPLATLPFTRQGHLPIIAVTIAGQSYDVALDSGASVNMLAESLLPVLKKELTNFFTSSLGGAAAQQQAVTGGTLRLATLAHRLPLHYMITVFMTIGPLARSQPTPVVGILGYEFLRQYRVTINYPQGVIEVR